MTDPAPDRTPSRTRLAAGLVFFAVLPVWTWLLVKPGNPTDEVHRVLYNSWEYLPLIASKGLHAIVFAGLAFLGWTWPPSGRVRTTVMALLVLYGIGTEIVQVYVPYRTGMLRDVFVNCAGIAAGVAARLVQLGGQKRSEE